MSKRRLWISMVLIGLVVLIWGCSHKQEVQETELSEKTVLEFWHTYSDLEAEVFETKVLPLFEEHHPHIQIVSIRKDYTEQLNNNVLAAVKDNKQPDLMRVDMTWVPQFAKSGALVNISEMEDFAEIRTRFIGTLLQTNMYHNAYYGLPINANTKAAIYNRNLLRAAGFSDPPQTFQQIIEITRLLKEKDPELYGIGVCCSSAWGTLPYFWTFGGQVTDEKHEQASGYFDSPASLAAVEKIYQLYQDGVISPAILGEEPGSWDGVMKGKVLMIEEAHWFFTLNANGENKSLLNELVVAPFPSDVNIGTSIIGGENIVLFKASNHQEEAWEFMKWMVSEQAQELMAETGLIPTIHDVKNKNQNPLFAPYLEQLAYAKPRPTVPAWMEIDKEMAKMFERILTEEQTIEAAVQYTTMKIDQLLAP